MKRISLIAFLCFAFVSTIFSMSFIAGDKEITLIDLPGYKHADISVFQGLMDLTGVEGKDLLIPDTAFTPGLDDDGVYHDYFIVSIHPDMILPFDLSTEDFADFKEVMIDEIMQGAMDIDVDSLINDLQRLDFPEIEQTSTPRIFINDTYRLGVSATTRWQGTDKNILSLTSYVLVKGKIVWLSYYTEYASVVDYENAVATFERFSDSFIRENEEEKKVHPLGEYFTSFQKDVGSGTKIIESNGLEKAFGLLYQVEVPETWQEKVSKQPHVVHSFSQTIGQDMFLNFVIVVDDTGSSIFSALSPESNISDFIDDPADMLPDGAVLLDKGFTTLDHGKRAAYMDYSYSQHILGAGSIDMHARMVALISHGKMVTLQLGVGGLSDNALSSEVFDLYKVLFLRILNTFHITDNDASKSSKMADEINQHFTSAIHQTILLAILLPIGAICLLALILRYGVIHHSMNKKNSAMASTAIGLTSVTVLYFVSGDSGALGAAIGSLLFYAIVRIGHTEYDAEVARLEEEKANVNHMREEVAQAKERADKDLTHASKIKEDAAKIWTEAKDAIEKADNIRKFADIEIERLKEELVRVQERNKRLEEERDRKDQSSKSEPFRKDRAYYENVIGISNPYTKETLKKQYRQKTSLYHPDKVNALGDKLRILAESEMKEINAAYGELQQYCIDK